MRSFISGSRTIRATLLLLAGCGMVAVFVEGVARVALDRVSKIQRRTADEYSLARTIGSGPAGQKRVLVVGNSLLDEDVRFDDVRSALGEPWQARRFVIENTFYLDWYYGLKRLFSEGAHPDVVVLTLSTRQWMRRDIRGDYSSYYLINTGDLPAVIRDLDLNATEAASLAVANVSKFWAARAEIRNFVLGHLMPDLGRLMQLSNAADPHQLTDDEVESVVRGRIARVKALTDAHGAQLILLLPPVLEPGGTDGASGFFQAARAVGVPTLRPLAAGVLGLPFYRDAGHHLNPAGASIFTSKLIPVLRNQLAALPTAPGANRSDAVATATY
jgi:hypothetical protein